MDQRIEKTYNALQHSMRSMLATKSWDQITITELCKLAGVSTSTFYSHFKDKEDLLDILLKQFENAMLTENNSRSLTKTRSFRFLPILTNHVNGNRKLFAKSNTSPEGYPVASRFSSMINRLVVLEINEAHETVNANTNTQLFIAGGIYNALVRWSEHSSDKTHLGILREIDELVDRILH